MSYMDNCYEQFRNPSPDFRSKPFWAWNGKLEEEELLRQVHVLEQMGFGGFFMHSRTGLETEYLSEEWFRLTRACAREGRKLGLAPWIYDEDRWPSGSAGGIVTQDARFRRKILTLTLETQGEASDHPLAVFAGRVDGLHLASGWRQLKGADRPQDGETRMVFRVHTMEPQSVYNGFTDADRLNLDATERFLDVTHRQYARKCGTEFAGIRGVFTDEPHRGMVFSDFSDPGERQNWSLPWTDDLPEAFRSAYGRDLIAQLPALFLQPGGQAMVEVKWQYMELLQRLFIERFLQPIQRWAHENGKRTTGHFLHEDSLMAQAVPCGSMMRCYPYLDEPGVDNLTEGNFTPWAVKALESVARQLGKQWKLSELYGATGWQMSFQDYKYVGDWQTLLGINVRCPHLSWYTMGGEAKRDYPGSFLHQATWYQKHETLETYFARLATAIFQGEPVCDTLVLHPVESLWCQIHPGWANGLEATDPAIQKLETQFTHLFDWLMKSQTDFDYGDEGLLAEYAAVESNAGGVCLRVGRMRYRRVIVAGCVNIRDTTLALLQAYQHAGGTLVFIGKPPAYVACQNAKECVALAKKSVCLKMQKAAVLAYFRQIHTPVRVPDPVAAQDLYLQLRRTDSCLFAVLWNKNRSRAYSDVAVEIPDGLCVQLWDCLTGWRYALPAADGCVRLNFAPGQEAVLCLTDRQEPLEPLRQAKTDAPLQLKEISGFALDEPNVLVLDRAELWLNGEAVAQETEILELDRILRRKLGLAVRGGEMVQPWARKEMAAHCGSVRLRYTIPVETCPEEPVVLALEAMPELTITLNGQTVLLEKTDRFWVDSCYGVYALPQRLWQLGENTLELTETYDADSGLEAMFLLGTFGVWFRKGNPTIGMLPKKLKTGNVVHQGLPFYSGKVTHEYPLPRSGPFTLKLPKIGGSCAIASCHGSTQCIPWPWSTSRWERVDAGESLRVQVVLNRRNTFGPLHRFPRKQPYIAPDSFTCEDAKRYCLYPMGMLQEPELCYESGEADAAL